MLNELAKMKMPYRSKIHIYLNRRDKLRLKYGIYSKEYAKHSYSITKRIKEWRRAIANIEKLERKMDELDEKVIDFIGVSVKGSGRSTKKDIRTAKLFFCRYGKEIGLPSAYIRAYIGLTGANMVGTARLNLIRKCAVDNELRNTWNNFKATINAA